MNPISKVTGVITRPARTAGAMAGATVGVGLRTTARVLGWAVERTVNPSPEQGSSARPKVRVPEAPAPEPPTKKAPTKKAPTKKAPAKKTSARKAPSKKAAVVAPALGLTEAEVEAGPDKG